jgi:hypothetical protein
MIEALADLVASGQIVDFILGIVAVEFAALCAYRWRTGRGPDALGLGFNLGAGAALLLAAQAALQDAAWTTIAAYLALGFAAHLADLVRRWPRA